jgi:hypothetical protein
MIKRCNHYKDDPYNRNVAEKAELSKLEDVEATNKRDDAEVDKGAVWRAHAHAQPRKPRLSECQARPSTSRRRQCTVANAL